MWWDVEVHCDAVLDTLVGSQSDGSWWLSPACHSGIRDLCPIQPDQGGLCSRMRLELTISLGGQKVGDKYNKPPAWKGHIPALLFGFMSIHPYVR